MEKSLSVFLLENKLTTSIYCRKLNILLPNSSFLLFTGAAKHSFIWYVQKIKLLLNSAILIIPLFSNFQIIFHTSLLYPVSLQLNKAFQKVTVEPRTKFVSDWAGTEEQKPGSVAGCQKGTWQEENTGNHLPQIKWLPQDFYQDDKANQVMLLEKVEIVF